MSNTIRLGDRDFRVGAWYRAARQPGPSRMAMPLRRFLGLGATRSTVLYETPEGTRFTGHATRWRRWAGTELDGLDSAAFGAG